MKLADDQPSGLTALDRPNSYIGRSVPRPNLARLTQGRGQYVSDVVLPRMVHVAFVRSPHAHARIKNIPTEQAKKSPGVVAVVTGTELAKMITPWVGVLTHLKGIKSAPQHAIAVDRACWQGEAVCAVVARTRAQAEDACAFVNVDYEALPAVTDAETALDAETPVIHPELGDNLTFERTLNAGDPDKGFAEADAVVETTFTFGRHTGVTNEPRAIVADWNPGDQRLTVYQGTQAPHMTQNIFAKHLGLEEHQVRVLTKDVGGSFGIKVHIYADEMATAALSKLLEAAGQIRRRPLRELRHRHPRPRSSCQREDRRKTRRHHHRVRHRRSDRHRSLFGLSAHQRHRSEPGREPGGRSLHLRELPRPRPRRVSEQERHVPIPRRRPSDRDGGDRGAWSSLRRRRSAWTRPSCGEKIFSRTTNIRQRAPPA